MENIKQHFKKYGYDFKLIADKQISETKRAAVYCAYDNGEPAHYEVQILRWVDPSKIINKFHWRYPGQNDWGLRGWTHKTEQRAMEHFKGLKYTPDNGPLISNAL